MRNDFTLSFTGAGLGSVRGSSVFGRRRLYRTDEPVAQPRQGFDIARCLGGILQCLPQALNGRVDTVVELDDGPVRPEFVVHRLARNHFAWIRQQHGQHLDGLIGNADLDPVAAKLSRTQIQLEHPKAEETGRASGAHRQNSWVEV